MELTGGGSWITLQKQAPGTTIEGSFVSFDKDVQGNPAYPPQDVLKLEIDGSIKSIGCPTALGRVFRNNRIEVGQALSITYEGKKTGKRGTAFHSFKVETLDDTFDPSKMQPANDPMQNEEAELERRLAAARARRSA